MASVTNETISSALRGEHPTVTLNRSDTDNVLPTLTVGQKCAITGNTGFISEIFAGGNTFLIRPINMGVTFNSNGAPGVLNAGEVITIT